MTDEVAEAARALRRGLNLQPTDPFDALGYLRRVAAVSWHDLSGVGEAVTARSPDTYHVYFDNSREVTPERLRFTAAHELGHIVLGHFRRFPCGPNMPDRLARQAEHEAYRFAACVLMPADAMTSCDRAPSALDHLRRRLGVSRESFARRLQEVPHNRPPASLPHSPDAVR